MNEYILESNNNGTYTLIFGETQKIIIDNETLEDIQLDELSITLKSKGNGIYIPYVIDEDYTQKLNRYIMDAVGKDRVYFNSPKTYDYTRSNLRKEIFGPRIQVIHNHSTDECCIYDRYSQSYTLLTTELNATLSIELDAFIKFYLSNDCKIQYLESSKELYCILNVSTNNKKLHKLQVPLNETDINVLLNNIKVD